MAFYHYTGLTALNGILNGDSDDIPNVRLWATRYDCFEDRMNIGLVSTMPKSIFQFWKKNGKCKRIDNKNLNLQNP